MALRTRLPSTCLEQPEGLPPVRGSSGSRIAAEAHQGLVPEKKYGTTLPVAKTNGRQESFMFDHTVTAADTLLDQWPHLSRVQRLQAFQRLPREYMDDLFLELDAEAQAELVRVL